MKECIILAGGFGTRLSTAVNDRPKCLANISNEENIPFLKLLINYLLSYNISRLIFSLGHKSDQVINFIKSDDIKISYIILIEKEPLDTGGAIKFALESSITTNPLIINADTFFNIDLNKLFNFHFTNLPLCTISLKKMTNFDRYGSVELNSNYFITTFKEKFFIKEGLINAGVMIINKNLFNTYSTPKIFSFEKDFLSKIINNNLLGMEFDEYFIDIGIPADYYKCINELKPFLKKYIK